MPAYCKFCLYLENAGPADRPRPRCVLWETWDPERLPDEACDVFEPGGEDPAPAASGAAAPGAVR